MSAREDVFCPACPDPDTAFRIADVGMKFSTESDLRHDDTVRFKVTRPAWKPVMLEHLCSQPDDAHEQLHAECVAALATARLTVKESAQRQVRAAAGWGRRAFDLPTDPHPPFPSAFTVSERSETPVVKATLNRERPQR